MQSRTLETLAKVSWMLAIVGGGCAWAGLIVREQRFPLWVAAAAVFGVGFCMGVWALAKAFGSGRERVFTHALVGTFGNGAFLCFMLVAIAGTPSTELPVVLPPPSPMTMPSRFP